MKNQELNRNHATPSQKCNNADHPPEMGMEAEMEASVEGLEEDDAIGLEGTQRKIQKSKGSKGN